MVYLASLVLTWIQNSVKFFANWLRKGSGRACAMEIELRQSVSGTTKQPLTGYQTAEVHDRKPANPSPTAFSRRRQRAFVFCYNPHQTGISNVAKQTIFGIESIELFHGKIVIGSVEAKHVEGLLMPVIQVHGSGIRSTRRHLEKQDAARHLNPPRGDGLSDPEKFPNDPVCMNS